MIDQLQRPEIQQFIDKHEHDNVHDLLLKYRDVYGVPTSIVVDQINGRRKAKEKLPDFYENKKIVYPPAINLEQSSSQRSANFKIALIKDHITPSLKSVADLTGGFGIDTFYLASIAGVVHYVEPDQQLISVSQHNHRQLGARNIQHHHSTAEAFLSNNRNFDLIYIDPSRRSKSNQKVHSLADCSPDVTQLQDVMLKSSNHLLVKTSPLLDIQLALKELHHVKSVHVLSIDNECKELLFLCTDQFKGEPIIYATNLGKRSTETFDFSFSEEHESKTVFGEVQSYLYEPNASILKAGAFKLTSERFGLKKLHVNTHLYTADIFVENFPGRVFKLLGIIKPEQNILAQFFHEGKANVTTRNYPLSVDELKKKTKLKDGGDRYLIGFTDVNQKKVLVAAERSDR